MTYRELLKKLQGCTKAELDQEVIVYMEADEVFYSVDTILTFPVEESEDTQMCIVIPSGGN